MSGLKKTVLNQWHSDLGAKMVPFAGYQMPVQYPLGVLKEHLFTRSKAGLFDVSHMGQVVVKGENSAAILESIFPANLIDLEQGKQCYSLLLNEQGGIIDDLMICKRKDSFFLVLNASRKAVDLTYLAKHCNQKLDFELLEDHALLALQGPESINVLSELGLSLDDLLFMEGRFATIKGIDCWITRSGYTGEDGVEISVHNRDAENLAIHLTSHESVEPIGLGARDSLRLEAGLCLYGQDLNEKTTPVEASLNWAIAKDRRLNSKRAGGFIGSNLIFEQQQKGADFKRIGLISEGKAPVRAGTLIYDANGDQIGEVTSGGFSPTLQKPIAMANVKTLNSRDEKFFAKVRGKTLIMLKTQMPFVPTHYYRG